MSVTPPPDDDPPVAPRPGTEPPHEGDRATQTDGQEVGYQGDLAQTDDLTVDAHEVVETDEVEGGWQLYDLSRPVPVVPVRLEDPTVVVARAAALMISTWRLDRGMSQTRAAERLGMEQTRLSRLERGRMDVSVELLARIASLTGSDVTLRIAPRSARPPVRRIVTEGRTGRVRVQLVVDGPEQRGVDRRPQGPIF